MARPAILKVDIIADAKGATRGVDQAESKFSKFGSSAAKVGKVAALGLAAAGAAAVVVGKKLWSMGEAAVTADARTANIAKSMGLFGKEADNVADRLSRLAEKTALQTGMDQNSIKATQAKLLTFGELAKSADQVGGYFDRANQAALDLAAAGFGAAETNAVQLGKALNDPVKGMSALSRSGITFTETEKARIETLVESNKMGKAQELVLAAIEKQVKGTAVATADGSARMAVGFSQLQEKIGRKLVPVMDKLATWVNDKLIPGAMTLGKTLAARLGPALSAVGGFITKRVVPAVQTLHSWFVDKIAPNLQRYVSPILDGIRKAFERITSRLDDNSGALSKVIGWLRKFAEFAAKYVLPLVGTVLGKAFEVLGFAIGLVVDVLATLVGWIDTAIDKIGDLVSWIGKIDMPDIKLPGWLGGSVALTVGRVDLAGAAGDLSRRLSYSYSGSAPTGWSTGAAGTASGSWATIGTGDGLTAGVVYQDNRITVPIDNRASLTDEVALARKLDEVLTRHQARMGRRGPLVIGS